MPAKIERLHNEPIITVVWTDPANVKQDMPESWKEVDRLIGQDESGVYCITDLRGLNMDIPSTIAGMALQRERRPGSSADPRIRSILVGSGIFLEIVTKGVRQVRGANANLPLFSTMEDALAYAREQIRK
ncbi:MAG: hypothetical protein JXB07_01575 [Anaerolineae bacterium]|nr:hypothetical protein [Anaerolineae bacterium]